MFSLRDCPGIYNACLGVGRHYLLLFLEFRTIWVQISMEISSETDCF